MTEAKINMANKPLSSPSQSPLATRPLVPADLPESRIVPGAPNQPTLRSVAHDISDLPSEVTRLIFKNFVPPNTPFRHRYDAAPFSVIYQPTVITFARLAATCKSFQNNVAHLRLDNGLIEFRKQGSRLEFDNMLKRTSKAGQSDTRSPVQTMDVSSTSTTSTSNSSSSSSTAASASPTTVSSATTSNTGAAQILENTRKNCRLRYGIDPVAPWTAHTPQRALVHIILGPSDLASSELNTHLQKEWQPGKRHLVFIDKLASDADCVKLASVLLEKVAMPDGPSRERAADVEELDINVIIPNVEQLPLAEAIVRCTSLLHLELCNPDLDMLKALTSLANLQSLKLRNCNVEDGPFQILASGKFKDTLQCLSVISSEFQIEHLRALRDTAGYFTNLSDLRLLSGLNGIDSIAADEIAQALPAFPSLDSFSMSFVNFNVVTQIMSALQKLEALRQLEFSEMTLTDDECAALFLQLPVLPLLESLVFVAPQNQAAASQLRIMLEKNTCRLQYLRLYKCGLDADAATELAAGLKANLSLKSLILRGASLDKASATILGQAIGNHPGLLDMQLQFSNIAAGATFCLLKGALASKSLISLDLASNEWHPESEQAVLGLLKANTSLIRLVLPYPHADNSAREAHAQVLAANCRRGKVWSGPSSS
jgi:hypothetical protein